MPSGVPVPVGFRTMHPAAVVLVGGVLAIAVIIQRPDLIPKIDEGNPACRQDDAVDQQDPPDGQFHLRWTLLLKRFFQSGQGCTGTADAAIAGLRIFLERQAAPKTTGEASAVKLVEELAVVMALHTQPRRILV